MGTIEVDVHEFADTAGRSARSWSFPRAPIVVSIDRAEDFSPCQDGRIAAWLFEHGDAGCGDSNWPKSLL